MRMVEMLKGVRRPLPPIKCIIGDLSNAERVLRGLGIEPSEAGVGHGRG